MLTEDQLRNLLLKAGDSVDVDPTAPPVAALPPRPWRTAGAALAIAATVAATAGFGLWLSGDDDNSGDETETIILGGVPEGTVPSLFAHTRESAAELLLGMGLRVEFREEISCDPAGRAIGTEPATGTPVDPGDTVTVLIAYQAANTDCMADLREPWAFVDFATGRGPAPRFADEVRLFVDGELVTTMPGDTAAEGIWPRPSALTELATAAGQVMSLEVHDGDHVRQEYRTPTLQVQEGTPPDEFCGIPRSALDSREALTLTIDIPVDGIFHCPVRVSIYRTNGLIDAVLTWTERPIADPPEQVAMPDVVGQPLAEARDELTAAGYTVRVEQLETCDPREGIVVEQAPAQTPAFDQDIDPDAEFRGVVVTLVVEVPHTSRDCAGLAAAAEQFIEFARGGAPPAWAQEVQLLLGYARQDSLTASQADNPDSWSMCSGVSPEDCTLSPLAVIETAPAIELGEGLEPVECEFIDLGGLPRGLYSEDAIYVFPPRIECEGQFAVALWIDDAGLIKAVNLLMPTTMMPQ